MFKLTKAELAQRADLVAALSIASGVLTDAIDEFNASLAAAREKLESIVNDYNETLSKARDFAEDIAQSRRDEWNDKSERWQESEAGQNANAFVDEWEGIELDDIEIEFPEPIEEPDITHGDDLETAPTVAE